MEIKYDKRINKIKMWRNKRKRWYEKIIIETTYGTFEYKVIGSKIIKETDVEEVPIQSEKELLMIYTCWPINNIGHATERYVVYANLVK